MIKNTFFISRILSVSGIVGVAMFFFCGSAHAISIHTQNSFLNQGECSGDYQTINRYIPIGSSSIMVYPKDRVWSNNLEFIVNRESNLQVGSTATGLVGADCIDSSRHFRQSSVSPGTGSSGLVDAFAMGEGSGCTLSKTSSITLQDRTAQFVYQVAYQPITGFSQTETTTNPSYVYIPSNDTTKIICINGSSWVNGSPGYCQPAQKKAIRGTTGFYDKECLNYVLHWCGDGVLDSNNGEQCDPADPNHTEWNGQSCSATCTRISNTCQNGGVTGQQGAAITLSTPNLCQAGQTAQNLRDTLTGTRHDYMWDCRDANGDVYAGGTCSAWWDSSLNPYSACVVGSPGTDCATNTYTTQAACLAANPAGSGRTCYLNDIASCNATRATQCPTAPAPSCTSLTITPNPVGRNSPVNLICAGAGFQNIASYDYQITAPDGAVTNSSNSGAYTTSFTQTGTYQAQCWANGTDANGTSQHITSSACGAGGSINFRVGAVECTLLQANPLLGNTPLTSNFRCFGSGFTNPQNYSIVFTPLQNILPLSNITDTGNGSGSGTRTFTATGTYHAQCSIDGTEQGGSVSQYTGVTSPACNLDINAGSGSCFSPLTRPLTGPINETTPNLCPSGQTVGAFTGMTVGTTTTYSWTCNGLVGGNCNATYTSGELQTWYACNSSTTCATNASWTSLEACQVANSGKTCYQTQDSCTTNPNIASECIGGGGGGANTACNLTGKFSPFLTITGPDVNGLMTAQFSPAKWLFEGVDTSSNYESSRPELKFSGAGFSGYTLDVDSQLEDTVGRSLSGSGAPFPITLTQVEDVEKGKLSKTITFQAPGNGSADVQLSFKDTNVSANCTPCVGPNCGGWGGGGSCNGSNCIVSKCGDGNVDYPLGEQCDPPGKSLGEGCWTCDSSCHLSCTLTQPGQIPLLGPDIIVGNNVRVFHSDTDGNIRFHVNAYTNPPASTYFPYHVCIENKAKDNIVTGSGTKSCLYPGDALTLRYTASNMLCSTDPLGWVSYGTESQDIDIPFSGLEIYKGLQNWSNSPDYKDSTVGWKKDSLQKWILDPQGLNLLFVNLGDINKFPYFKYGNVKEDNCRRLGTVNVRVVKSIISNTSGGNAYNPKGVTINSVTDGFLDALKNGNFTTSAKSASGDWSLTKTTTSTTATNTVKTITNMTNVKTSNSPSALITTIANLLSDTNTTKLGDNTDVRVIKTGDLTLQLSPTDKLTGVKTIIVENGDLVINKDIAYADANASWAFIVKNGNIVIDENVKNIAGVFMTLGTDKGIMAKNNIDSSIQLRVEGSLYGDPGNLVSHRTYVYGTTNSTALATGVIINYSNRALKFPPPMLTNFIETYKLQKVSK